VGLQFACHGGSRKILALNRVENEVRGCKKSKSEKPDIIP